MSQDGTGTSDPRPPEPGPPNPFSREGAAGDDPRPPEAEPTRPYETTGWPGYPAPEAEPTRPYETTGWPGTSRPEQQPGYQQDYGPAPEPAPHPPTDVPPYPNPGYAPADPYAPANPYVPANPYAPAPFTPSVYGLGSPYGVAPQHPQAVTALVLGIVGLVVCPPVGIAGIVTGLRVRRDSDARPGQFTGRGLGTAGLALGITSIVVMIFWIVVFAGVYTADY